MDHKASIRAALVAAIALAAAPAAAQNSAYIFCSAWGDEGRHFYSELFRGQCQPTVTRQGNQTITLEHMCRQGAPPATQFSAFLKGKYEGVDVSFVECFKGAEAQARRDYEAEQRRDKDGGDEPVLTGWSPS